MPKALNEWFEADWEELPLSVRFTMIVGTSLAVSFLIITFIVPLFF